MDCTGCWQTSKKEHNPEPNDTAAQCDQDAPGGNVTGWPTGLEGRLWQDVTPSGEHSQVTFTATEVQHHGSNTAEWHLYGELNGEWIELWSRLEFGNDVPPVGTTNKDTWYTNEYSIPVTESYGQYRVEALCHVQACLNEGEQCGWKFSLLEIKVDQTAIPAFRPSQDGENTEDAINRTGSLWPPLNPKGLLSDRARSLGLEGS